MKFVRRIVISLGIIGFALAAGAVLLFNRPTLGWQLLSVPTGSMRPGIAPGSLVLVHRVSNASLRVGDVITFTNPLTMRTTLTHRIIRAYKINGRTPAYITKGDANPSADPSVVVAGLVQGRLVGHVPYVGSLLMWAKTWVGIAVLVYLPALLITIHETRRLAAYLRQTRPYVAPGRLAVRSGHVPTGPPKVALASGLLALLLAVGLGWGWQSASATAGGGVVTLAPNKLRSAVVPPGGSAGDGCTSATNVTVRNSSNQTATSGSATSSGNTTGGSATSGNAANSTSSSVVITTHNGC